MNRFKNILVVARGDYSSTLERARRLAEINEARLTLVDVVEELPATSRLVMSSARMADLEAAERLSRQVELDGSAAELREAGLEVEVEVRTGRPFIEIIRRVLAHEHDLVIKPALGEGKIAFGSTGMHLMRKCPCPVWLIKREPVHPYAGILAAVDPDPEREESAALNRLILDLATSLAQREGSTLHVVHAWRVYGEETLRHGVNRMSDIDMASLLAEEEKRRRGWMEELLADYLDHEMVIHLVHGAPYRVIPHLARRKEVELIVMGSVARTGISGYFIGNTAEMVLTEVDCSVITVKPAGFVTPVTLPSRSEDKLSLIRGSS